MQAIDKTLRQLHRIQATTRFTYWIIVLFRSLLAAGILASLWLVIDSSQIWPATYLGLMIFFVSFLATIGAHRNTPITKKNMLFALEIDNPKTESSAFDLADQKELSPEWQVAVQKYEKECRKIYRRQISGIFSTLPIPLFLMALIAFFQPQVISLGAQQLLSAVDYFKRGAVLTIEEGRVSADTVAPIGLNRDKTADVSLLEENLLHLELRGFARRDQDQTSPIIELRDEKTEEIFQTFQTNESSSENDSFRTFELKFSVSKNLLLYIPSISPKALARFEVKKRPIPEVELTALEEITNPWPDDQPLKLQIKVLAKNPLQLIRLVIVSGKQRAEELVTKVVADDMLELETTYDLLLESYTDGDRSEVEVFAEAIDRALPTPLIGQSLPLRISTASAYGRYRQVLEHLRKVKTSVDRAIEENSPKLSEEALKASDEAAEQAPDTPFFDGLDRSRINELDRLVQDSVKKNERTNVLRLSEQLNSFLFEHETLDDRERDRDFFVATRGLSRVISQDKSRRPVSLEIVSERIQEFLKERQMRWGLRANRVEKSRLPENWQHILTDKPFASSLKKITQLAESDKRDNALKELSNTINKYRTWIEGLEKAEDEQRKTDEQKREEGLTSARNELKELQKVQDQISTMLDKSAQQSSDELAGNWPKARSQQNTNLTGTKKLEAQLRSLSPTASERIKAAVGQMDSVLEKGNDDGFSQAESHSDFASRLLRQAESAAQQSQKQERSRGRRRRVSGDSYHGQNIMGGDVEIRYDYEVDRRYREDILDEIQDADQNPEDARLLDNYLRRVVR